MFDSALFLIGFLSLILLFFRAKVHFLSKRKVLLHPKFKIIGVTGLKYNGKDTIADHLCKKYGFTRIAFADPLKNACAILFGFTHEQLHGSLKETPDNYWFGLSPRKVLQFVGTDLFRKQMKLLHEDFGEDFWLLCAKKLVNDIFEKDKENRVVISDVRFPNECEMIKKMGGIVIRVNRPSINTSADLHDSERLIPTLEVDYEITNDGSIGDLNRKVDTILYVYPFGTN